MGKRSRHESDAPASRAFAPGLALKKQKTEPECDEGEPVFSWTKQSSSGFQGSWSTFDPKTATRTWSTSAATTSNKNNNEPAVLWDKWADTPIMPILDDDDGLDVAAEVRQQFVEERFLMREDQQHRSAFEHRNKRFSHVNSAARIVSQVGDQEVVLDRKIDDRAEFRNSNNEYIDGKDRGKMAKRFEEELQTRRTERREQMQRADTLYNEWKALSEKERQSRRAQARKNRDKVLESLDVELEEKMPAAYQINNDALWDRICAYKATLLAQASVQSPSQTRIASTITEDDNESDGLFLPLESDCEVASSPHSAKPQHAHSRPFETRPQQQGYRAPHSSRYRNYPRRLDGSRSQYATSWDQYTPSQGSRTPLTTNPSKNPTMSTQDSSRIHGTISSTPSTFEHETWPELMPLEDITDIPEREYINDEVRFHEVRELCSKRGRLVIVSLAKGVEYSSAMILDRVFGGAIQEIQFFPAKRQALIAYLSPLDASGFLEHIAACQRESAYEYRDLQIHAAFYKGTVESAVYPAQDGLLTSAVVDNTSRVLSVDKIHKDIKREVLLHALKGKFVDKHLVRFKLVQATRNSLRAKILCNTAIIEFASMKQAFDAKQMFDAHQVSEFEHCTATFLSDPVGKVPKIFKWCSCVNCNPKPVVDMSQVPSTDRDTLERISRFIVRQPEKTSKSVGSQFLREVKRLRVSTREEWDVKNDSMRPEEYGDRLGQPLQPRGGNINDLES